MRGGSGQDGTEDGRGWNNILKKGKKGGKKEGEGREEKGKGTLYTIKINKKKVPLPSLSLRLSSSESPA